MASAEVRLAFVEGRVEEHSVAINDIRDALRSLEDRLDRRFDAIDLRFLGVDQRLDALDAKMSRQFTWLVGLYVTGLIAVVAALIAR